MSIWIQVGGIAIGPLGHTWSLAIKEQYYLVWPTVLLVARGSALRLAVATIVVASIMRLVATGPLGYFSTVTRGDAILVGCVVSRSSGRLGRVASRWLGWRRPWPSGS